MSAPAPDGGLGATEPDEVTDQLKFTQETQDPHRQEFDERNLNDAQSFNLIHSLGNMGNESNKIFLTKETLGHNVEEPLNPVSVGDQIVTKDNVLRPADYINSKMMDI
jgi:hypothetical protein